MRYVNCSRNSAEQNLHAFQYKDKIYYWTSREIEKDEELLVYYGDVYARELGLSNQENLGI